jgi:serine phosphatase RsbU (regulator of sigma subunit)
MYYEEKETVIAPGDSLVFLSDGLVEAHNANGEMFGNPRLQEWIARHDVNGSGMIEYLLAELAEFTGPDWEQEDDVTLVTLEYLANESMAVEASYSRISGVQ